jgi:hypothetical protein
LRGEPGGVRAVKRVPFFSKTIPVVRGPMLNERRPVGFCECRKRASWCHFYTGRFAKKGGVDFGARLGDFERSQLSATSDCKRKTASKNGSITDNTVGTLCISEKGGNKAPQRLKMQLFAMALDVLLLLLIL